MTTGRNRRGAVFLDISDRLDRAVNLPGFSVTNNTTGDGSWSDDCRVNASDGASASVRVV